jgi:hypothetical protein
MSHRAQPSPPAARTESVLVEELGTETVVYDVQRREAHALAPIAAAVFASCDGHRSVPELARLASERISDVVTDEQVWDALVELERCELLQEPTGGGISRRQVIKGASIAAVAAPLITSLAMPSVALATQSCNIGTACTMKGQTTQCTGVKITNGLCDDSATMNATGSCEKLVGDSGQGGNTVTCYCYTGPTSTCDCNGKTLTYTNNTCQFV